MSNQNMMKSMVEMPGILAAMAANLEEVIAHAIKDSASLLSPDHVRMLAEAHGLQIVPTDGDEKMNLLLEMATEAELQLVPMESWEAYQTWSNASAEEHEQQGQEQDDGAEEQEQAEDQEEQEPAQPEVKQQPAAKIQQVQQQVKPAQQHQSSTVHVKPRTA